MDKFIEQGIKSQELMEQERQRFLKLEFPKIRESGGDVSFLMDEVLITLPEGVNPEIVCPLCEAGVPKHEVVVNKVGEGYVIVSTKGDV
jgi:hypothetical protein